MGKWLSGDSNIYQMNLTDDYMVVDIVNLSPNCEDDCVDVVKIPIDFINDDSYHVVLEQLQTNDLKHVGYLYEPCYYKLNEPFKTMYHTQVRGTLSIFIKNIKETTNV